MRIIQNSFNLLVIADQIKTFWKPINTSITMHTLDININDNAKEIVVLRAINIIEYTYL